MARAADSLEFCKSIAFGNGDLSPEVSAWLQTGFQRFLRGECQSLEIALRLTGGNRLAARNQALAHAATLIDAGRALPFWELAGLLAHAIKRFESGPLALIRRGAVVALDDLNDALLRSFQAGARMQRTQRGLYDLLKNSP